MNLSELKQSVVSVLIMEKLLFYTLFSYLFPCYLIVNRRIIWNKMYKYHIRIHFIIICHHS